MKLQILLLAPLVLATTAQAGLVNRLLGREAGSIERTAARGEGGFASKNDGLRNYYIGEVGNSEMVVFKMPEVNAGEIIDTTRARGIPGFKENAVSYDTFRSKIKGVDDARFFTTQSFLGNRWYADSQEFTPLVENGIALRQTRRRITSANTKTGRAADAAYDVTSVMELSPNGRTIEGAYSSSLTHKGNWSFTLPNNIEGKILDFDLLPQGQLHVRVFDGSVLRECYFKPSGADAAGHIHYEDPPFIKVRLGHTELQSYIAKTRVERTVTDQPVRGLEVDQLRGNR